MEKNETDIVEEKLEEMIPKMQIAEEAGRVILLLDEIDKEKKRHNTKED
jgi:hypothetical protein